MANHASHGMDSVELSRQTPNRPRNQLLSAYYGLPSTTTPSSATRDSPSSSPELNALSLIQRLSLPRLLSSSADIERHAQDLTSSLNESVIATYNQLSSAHEAANDALTSSSRILTQTIQTTKQLEATAGKLAAVNDELQHVRDNVTRAAGLKRVVSLLRAGEILQKSLKEDYNAVVELCTDPEGTWKKFLLTARRYSIVEPILRAVKDASKVFEDMWRTLNSVGEGVREDLEESLVGADVKERDELPLGPAIKVMTFLGGEKKHLEQIYWLYATRGIDELKPTEASLENIGDSPVARVAYYVSFFVDVIVPRASSLGEEFASIFNEVDLEAAGRNRRWMESIFDDHLIAPVRTTLSKAYSFSPSLEQDVQEFKTSLQILQSCKLPFALDHSVLEQLCETLDEDVMKKVRSEAQNAIWTKAEIMLGEDYTSKSDSTHGSGGLHRALDDDLVSFSEFVQTISIQLGKMMGRTDCGVVGDDIRRSLVKRLSSRSTNHVVAVRLLHEVKAEEEYVNQVLESYKRTKVAEIAVLFREEVRMVIEESKNPSFTGVAAGHVREVSRLLEQVKQEISMMSTSETATSYMSHGLYSGSHLLEDTKFGVGAVFSGALRSWVDAIREIQLDNEAAVHIIQRDAHSIARITGLDVEPVVQAAIGQCQAEVSLLENSLHWNED